MITLYGGQMNNYLLGEDDFKPLREKESGPEKIGCRSQTKKYETKVWGRKGKEDNELLTY